MSHPRGSRAVPNGRRGMGRRVASAPGSGRGVPSQPLGGLGAEEAPRELRTEAPPANTLGSVHSFPLPQIPPVHTTEHTAGTQIECAAHIQCSLTHSLAPAIPCANINTDTPSRLHARSPSLISSWVTKYARPRGQGGTRVRCEGRHGREGAM